MEQVNSGSSAHRTWFTLAGCVLLVIFGSLHAVAGGALLANGSDALSHGAGLPDSAARCFGALQLFIGSAGVIGAIAVLRGWGGHWTLSMLLLFAFPAVNALNGMALYRHLVVIDIAINLLFSGVITWLLWAGQRAEAASCVKR